MMGMFYIRCCLNRDATSHMWIEDTRNEATVIKKLNFEFYFISMSLDVNVNSHVWLVGAGLGNWRSVCVSLFVWASAGWNQYRCFHSESN